MIRAGFVLITVFASAFIALAYMSQQIGPMQQGIRCYVDHNQCARH